MTANADFRALCERYAATIDGPPNSKGQRAVARALGVSEVTVRRWVFGSRNVPAYAVEALEWLILEGEK
jgi:hypothetical protein